MGGRLPDAWSGFIHASQGRPRSINQLALQSLIQAAVEGRDQIDGDFMAGQIAAHPLSEGPAAGAA